MEPFAQDYDAAAAEFGPPAIFLLTHEHTWRLMPDLTRDGWVRLERTPERDIGHGHLRDHATGFVTRVYTTGKALMEDHPRASITWFESAEQSAQAYAALGRPPLDRKGP